MIRPPLEDDVVSDVEIKSNLSTFKQILEHSVDFSSKFLVYSID